MDIDFIPSHGDPNGEPGDLGCVYKFQDGFIQPYLFIEDSMFPRRVRLSLRKSSRMESMAIMQMIDLEYDNIARAVVYRCLRYRDRIPLKYRRKYGEVIKQLKKMMYETSKV